MPFTCAISCIISAASLSSVTRSGPMIFAELAPRTPDRPSSTLSWMYWEKLKPIPVNSLANWAWSSSTILSLFMSERHSSNGLSGTKNSALKNPAASLPLSGRPCCDTTVIDLGVLHDELADPIDDRHARFERNGRRHRRADPQIAFLQRRQEFAAQAGADEAADDEEDRAGHRYHHAMAQRPVQHRRVDRAQHPHHEGLRLVDVLGQQQRREARRDGERRDQRSDERIGVSAGHRAEYLALDALHGEERNEGRHDDGGGEEHRLVDLQRADEDQAEPVGPARRGSGAQRARRIGAPFAFGEFLEQQLPFSGGSWKFR